MTRELNVRITLEERNGHTFTNNAYANIIKLLLEKATYVISVDSVQVETVSSACRSRSEKPESEKK